MAKTKVKSAEYNTSTSMGTYGAEAFTGSKTINRPISSITVLGGTTTVTGKQLSSNRELEDWSSVEFGNGTYITPLTEVVLSATGTTIVYYA